MHKDEERDEVDGIEFAKSTSAALDRIAPGTIVGGTAWLWAHPDAIGRLDVLVIDEAGQMALAQALAAARAARVTWCCWATRSSSNNPRAVHTRTAPTSPRSCTCSVRRRPRYAPSKACSSTGRIGFTRPFARSRPRRTTKVGCGRHSGLERQRIGGATPFAGSGPFLVEVAHEGNQAQAREEVDAVVAIARSLLQPGTTWTNADGQIRPLEPNDILVVAPYNAQVSALKRTLADAHLARVGTVDKFQGQEAPVVIYSCTSSSPEDAPRGMAFLYDPHRFNVATSRARSTVIVVASPRLFEPDCRTPEQMGWANGFCRFAEMAVRVSVP